MNQNLEISVKRYDELSMMLGDPVVLNDHNRYLELLKEFNELEPLVKNIKRLTQVQSELAENKDMLYETEDQEFRDLIREEIAELELEAEQLDSAIKELMIPKIPMIIRMLLLKLGPVPVVTKLLYLPEICLECIPHLQKLKAGLLI